MSSSVITVNSLLMVSAPETCFLLLGEAQCLWCHSVLLVNPEVTTITARPSCGSCKKSRPEVISSYSTYQGGHWYFHWGLPSNAAAPHDAMWANMSKTTSTYLSHAYQGPWVGILERPYQAVRPAKVRSATGSFNKWSEHGKFKTTSYLHVAHPGSKAR